MDNLFLESGSEVGVTAEGAGHLGLVTEETMTCC